MMVLGEGRLSFGRNMQQDCSSICRGEVKGKEHTLNQHKMSPTLDFIDVEY